ncbi:MAG: glutamine-hydrolyzing GMP synthase [Porticoccus sp.]|nr:glutamine-hydrolyzing GMP synthase [Porticoccus sp.]
MTNIKSKKILILDFGSQYTQLIARRVREIGVYSEVHTFDMHINEIIEYDPSGIILAGGPESVTNSKPPCSSIALFDMGIPILGICYGMQIMAEQLGGSVENSSIHEFGFAQIKPHNHSTLLNGLADQVDIQNGSSLDVWMSHGDRVSSIPPSFKLMASSESCPIAGMFDEKRNFYGLQFHPEVTHTKRGAEIFERFVVDICDCKKIWIPSLITKSLIKQIKKQVGSDNVLLALSGGVDSSVVAALLNEAIGDQLYCIFVDNGLLRKGESDNVMAMFSKNMGINVVRADAVNFFLDRLAGEKDPEKKRKIIGKAFVDVFEREAAKMRNVKWLAQGTIYPDVIESAASKTGKAHLIKSHHNVGGLPDSMRLKLVEPLRDLFKDEVRKIGIELGLPHEMVNRHPFPGPGLAVRVLGEVKKEYAELLREADAIFIEELRATGWYEKTSQAFVVFLPVKSVGVVGDARRYEYVVSLRAVETIDFMTARWAHLPYDLLEKVSNRIINEINGISRVTYDISSKPPATIEWE